jgi:hypothetical protein
VEQSTSQGTIFAVIVVTFGHWTFALSANLDHVCAWLVVHRGDDDDRPCRQHKAKEEGRHFHAGKKKGKLFTWGKNSPRFSSALRLSAVPFCF